MKKVLLFGVIVLSSIQYICAADVNSVPDVVKQQMKMKMLAVEIVRADMFTSAQAFATSCASVSLLSAFEQGKFTLTAGITTAIAAALLMLPTKQGAQSDRTIYQALVARYNIKYQPTFSDFLAQAYMSENADTIIPALWGAFPVVWYFFR